MTIILLSKEKWQTQQINFFILFNVKKVPQRDLWEGSNLDFTGILLRDGGDQLLS